MIRRLPPGVTPTAGDYNALVEVINNQLTKISTAGDIGAEYENGRYLIRDGRSKSHYAKLTDFSGPDGDGIIRYAHHTVERGPSGWIDMPATIESEYPFGTTTSAPAMELNDTPQEIPRVVKLSADPQGNGWLFDASLSASDDWVLIQVTGPIDTTGYGHGYQPGVIIDPFTGQSTSVYCWINEEHEQEIPWNSPLGHCRVWGKFLAALPFTGTEDGYNVYTAVFGRLGQLSVVTNVECVGNEIEQTNEIIEGLWLRVVEA